MKVNDSKQILSNLYGLLMEINFHRTDDDVLAELENNPDNNIDDHLLKIKRLNAKFKASENKFRFEKVKEQIQKLKELGAEEINKLLKPEDKLEVAPLYRKFEEITAHDEKSIMEDQELLQLLKLLNQRLDEDPK